MSHRARRGHSEDLGFLCAIAWLACGGPALAQTPSPSPAPRAAAAAQVPAFNTIRTPTSPAFTLLGVEPSSVERPNTPASLALSFLRRVADVGTVPGDFALEVSPYWLVGHPLLRWTDDDTRTPWESIIRTATVSVATGQTGTKELPVTNLSIGGRASLWSGSLTQETKASVERLATSLQAESALGLRLMAEQLKELTAQLRSGKITAEEYTRLMAVLQSSTLTSNEYKDSAEVKAVEKEMQKFASNREGFFLELAAAGAWSYPGAVWDHGSFNRWGFWATPSYQTAKLSATGVIRYLSKADEVDAGAWDLGVRGTHSNDRYALSLEYVRRTFVNTGVSARYRLVGVAEYAAWEGTWLIASFGRDYATDREGSLVARLGLSFDMSKERYDFTDAAAKPGTPPGTGTR